MSSVICTLFESHYHYGVVALTNSLYKNGFKGVIYAGYRGKLPDWANAAVSDNNVKWNGSRTLRVSNLLTIHFLPVNTDSHFTNYKPEFILKVWDLCNDQHHITGIFYFDPDIIIKCKWDFYETWITYGVALVHEIVWNDMPPTHPKRQQWLKIASEMGFKVNNQLNSLINAGFIGISRNRMGFIKLWRDLIDYSFKNYAFDKSRFAQSDLNSDIFLVGDQDLLNLTAMCTDEKLSEFGPDGMDFIGGGWLMSHATGSIKPWRKTFLLTILNGLPPSSADKEYWFNVNGPVHTFTSAQVKVKRLSILIASFIGRFYQKN